MLIAFDGGAVRPCTARSIRAGAQNDTSPDWGKTTAPAVAARERSQPATSGMIWPISMAWLGGTS